MLVFWKDPRLLQAQIFVGFKIWVDLLDFLIYSTSLLHVLGIRVFCHHFTGVRFKEGLYSGVVLLSKATLNLFDFLFLQLNFLLH